MQLHASAAGRILLAYGTDALREKILSGKKLERFTPMTTVDSEKINNELPQIKKQGYAINRGERELEVAAIASPIFNHEQIVDSALAVVGPVQRFSDDRIPILVEYLTAATRRISRSLGAPV